jgi:hypothetical protein
VTWKNTANHMTSKKNISKDIQMGCPTGKAIYTHLRDLASWEKSF